MHKISTLSILSLFLAIVANAQRIKTEDFNYSAGQLTNLAGGADVSGGAWVSFSGTGKPLQVVAGNLSYPNYVTDPNGTSGRLLMDSSVVSAEDAYLPFDTVKANTVYISFLLNVDLLDNIIVHDSAFGEYFVGLFASNTTSSYAGRIYIRQGSTANTYNLGIAAQAYTGTPISWASADLSAGTTYLITEAYQIVEGANNDIAKLWIDPPNVSSEPTPDASSTFTTGTEPINIQRFALRQGYNSTAKTGTPKCQVDAIKISSSWSDATLPLQLTAFSIISNNGYNSLSWQTCNEINVDHFEIQRSANTTQFTSIANVAAKNAGCATTYTFSDAKLLGGTSYYRIKSVDKDGRTTYSGILSVNAQAVVKISVSPNPVSNYIVVSHPQAEERTALQIVTLNGTVVKQQSIQAGAIQTSIPVSNLAKGTYILIFRSGNTVQTTRFVK